MIKNRRWCLFLFYFALGISTTIFNYAMRMDLKAYNLSLSMLSYQLMFPNLPWTFKCIMAVFSDTFQCCGLNKKPYLVLTNLLSFVFCLLLIIPNLNLGQYIGLQFGLQLFAAWADVMYDSIMIYEANLEDVKKDGTLQSRIGMCRTLGRIVGKTGPLMWQKVGSNGVFIIMSVFYLAAAFLSSVMRDIPVQSRGPLDKGYFCTSASIVADSLRHPVLKVLLVFNILSGLIPSASIPTFFFLNDVVKMTPAQITALQLIGELTELVVLALYRVVFSKISIRSMYAVVCVLKVISGVLPYFLVAHADDNYPHRCHHDLRNVTANTSCFYYEQYNLAPFPLALGDNVIGEILDELQSLPLAVVTKTVCFHVLGATVYTFTLALQNGVSAIHAYIDSSMMMYFDIDHGKYNALPEYVKFCSALDGITLCLVGLLPKESTREFRARVEAERTSQYLCKDFTAADEDLVLELNPPPEQKAAVVHPAQDEYVL
jgi:hypothetical protein